MRSSFLGQAVTPILGSNLAFALLGPRQASQKSSTHVLAVFMLRTVYSETKACESRVSFVVSTLETLRDYMVSGLPVESADIGDLVQPRSVVHVTRDVHLLPSPERDVRQYCQ